MPPLFGAPQAVSKGMTYSYFQHSFPEIAKNQDAQSKSVHRCVSSNREYDLNPKGRTHHVPRYSHDFSCVGCCCCFSDLVVDGSRGDERNVMILLAVDHRRILDEFVLVTHCSFWFRSTGRDDCVFLVVFCTRKRCDDHEGKSETGTPLGCDHGVMRDCSCAESSTVSQ